jgi:tRNA U34 5-methylaminomethyl-2-thiouridine-forming methyltransferase MnmC
MKREIIISEDGSNSIFVPEFNEHYHSIHGAIAESMFIFIQEGFEKCDLPVISILEIGFGTGLNTLLTKKANEKSGKKISYFSVEKYPLTNKEWGQFNYPQLIPLVSQEEWNELHHSEWNRWIDISENFILFKALADALNFTTKKKFDLVYYDAFSPEAQPELWSEKQFIKIYDLMNPNSTLLTYSVKGSVKRALKSAGFSIEKLPGPKGKREILRAFKS